MKRNKYNVAVVILLVSILSAFQLNEDPHFLETLESKLREYNNNYPEEKIYLQFDKPFYTPGEDIWFNAFILNSNTHKPSLTSEVVYVELLDPKGNVASQLSLVVKEGTAYGDFSLRENAPGGLYQVRAYTQWMKNFGEENLFKKEIQVQRVTTPRLLIKLDYEKESYGPGNMVKATLKITNLKKEKVIEGTIRFKVMIAGAKWSESNAKSDINGEAIISYQLPDSLKTTDGLLQAVVTAHGVEESISRSIPIVLNKITLQFFPEGGQWVENVSGSLAFKALNEFGKGADISGIVVDEKGRNLTSFESFHMGMGAFKMVPVSGKKYFAKITTPIGNESLIPLPEPSETGFTFQLQSVSKSRVNWNIHAPLSTEAYIVGQSHGEIAYASKVALEKGQNTIEIPTENFPAGIGVFTLFDYHGTEQCERLVFLKKDNNLNIHIKTDKAQYTPGEKVQIKIETTDQQGKALPSKLSLSVVDDQVISFADDKQNNILSYMLLSSEVRGEIQEPSFYFDRDEPKSDKALDYLLMTQGWRRFSWKEMTDMKRPIVYNPEKVKNLSGRVVHNGLGFHSEITLVELGNKQRIDKIETTANGHFLFKNIDPTVPVLLLAKKPGEIIIQKEEAFAVMLRDTRGARLLMDTIKEPIVAIPTLKAKATVEESEVLKESKSEIGSGLNLTLEEDVAQLSEIVVTGYGFENKRSLSGSYTTLYQRDIDGKLPMAAMEGLLQGRVAGVVVQPQTGNAGSNAIIHIRGSSSLTAGRAEPLYVIDGHPMAGSLNRNFSTFGIIGPEDIQSIEVIASPEAASLFGSAAANGVILITTKSHLGYTPFKMNRRLSRYNGQTIQPRRFSAAREFYVPPPPKNVEKREDFRTTLYWSHTIVTNDQGIANFSFYNNDAISSFRITAEGFSRSGAIGRTEEVYSTQLPFSLDAKLPEFIGFEDTLRIPVQVKNETTSNLTGTLEVVLPPSLSVQGSHSRTVFLKARSAQTFTFTVTSNGVEGEFPLAINLTLPDYHDKVERLLRVQPAGFPTQLSISSRALDKKIRFSVDQPERGTMKAELVAFPDVISDLFTGAEAILREPHGCFEQVSSSTFPNILALQFLKQSGSIRPHVEGLALRYIEQGYQKLKAYEIEGGGFEWFGHPPAHEGLTAYGLVEFYEMKKIFPSVSDDMLDRTREWLLSRRDGKGGFNVNGGKYGFSGASSEVSNAYLTYALSETGTKDILPEYAQAYQEAIRSEDLYRQALMACASYNLNKIDNYNQLINIFTKRVRSAGFDNLNAEHSIVRSYGKSLAIETISLWTIALLKSSNADRTLTAACINHILNNRTYGQFGSTQGTTLALKALTEYATLVASIRDDGEIQILIDNLIAEKYTYQKEEREKIILNNFAKNITGNGDREMRIVFNGTKEPLPYTITLQWHSKQPQKSDQCKVNITTQLGATRVALNETVRLKATIKNKTSEGLPMITAMIGIPAGLSLQPWQLKELKEKQAFDFYEIHNGNLILYYREMAPNSIQIVNLDLKAEIPGTFTGSASSAYLYYTNEFKDWVAGNPITIN